MSRSICIAAKMPRNARHVQQQLCVVVKSIIIPCIALAEGAIFILILPIGLVLMLQCTTAQR